MKLEEIRKKADKIGGMLLSFFQKEDLFEKLILDIRNLSKLIFNDLEVIYDGTQQNTNSPRSFVCKSGEYCIKFYLKSPKSDFEQEEKNLQLLGKYGFAPKYHYGSKEFNYIIMEYIEGEQLGKYGELYPKDIQNSTKISKNHKDAYTNMINVLDELHINYENHSQHLIIDKNNQLRMIDFNI